MSKRNKIGNKMLSITKALVKNKDKKKEAKLTKQYLLATFYFYHEFLDEKKTSAVLTKLENKPPPKR